MVMQPTPEQQRRQDAMEQRTGGTVWNFAGGGGTGQQQGGGGGGGGSYLPHGKTMQDIYNDPRTIHERFPDPRRNQGGGGYPGGGGQIAPPWHPGGGTGQPGGGGGYSGAGWEALQLRDLDFKDRMRVMKQMGTWGGGEEMSADDPRVRQWQAQMGSGGYGSGGVTQAQWQAQMGSGGYGRPMQDMYAPPDPRERGPRPGGPYTP